MERQCRYCTGLPDSYEVDGVGRCIVCLDTRTQDLTECEGCEQERPDIAPYLIEHHDGGSSEVVYCADCAELARMDWNGETKSIAQAPVREVGNV